MYAIRIGNINIPLSVESSASIERNSTLWQQSTVSGEYSFSFDIPITPELRRATYNLAFDKSILSGSDTEYTCAIVDGGFSRYHGTIKFLGRKGNRVQCTIKIGSSVLSDFLTNTKLRSLDLETVVLNADPLLKFVTFQVHQPTTGGDVDQDNFGMSVNGLFNSVPFNTSIPQTLTDFCVDYNASFSAINGNTASSAAAFITFTANEEGGSWLFDYSNSILDAEVPTNGIHPATITLSSAFDYADYAETIAAAAKDETISGTRIAFPVIKNPKFSSHADYCGYVNYTEPGAVDISFNDGSTTFWKFHLLPLPYLVHVLGKIFELQGYTVIGDFITDEETSTLLIYNTQALDEAYPITDSTSFNIWKASVVINEHVPDITCADLINSCMLRFNLYRVTNENDKTVSFGFVDSVMTDNTAIDYSAEVEDTNDFDFPDRAGLTLKLAQDSNDDLYEELIRDIKGFTVIAESPVDVPASLPATANNFDLCFVTNLTQYHLQMNQHH